MDESNNKKDMRLIYPFKNDEALNFFHEGMLRAYVGETEKSIELFRKSIDSEPDNPIPYNFLIMSLEFTDSTEDERRELSRKWADVASKSGNTTQMLRATMAVKYYEMTPEERTQVFKHGNTNN